MGCPGLRRLVWRTAALSPDNRLPTGRARPEGFEHISVLALHCEAMVCKRGQRRAATKNHGCEQQKPNHADNEFSLHLLVS